jgi:hypothetical protein
MRQAWSECRQGDAIAISSSLSRPGKNRARYWRDIAAVLSLKAFAFGLIYLFCFAPTDGLDPSAATMFRHFISPAASSTCFSSWVIRDSRLG